MTKKSFTNSTGAIKITKINKNANFEPSEQPNAGVTFQVSLDGQLIDTVDTDGNGTAFVEGLVPGQEYTVTEIGPENYTAASTNPQSVTVSPGATSSKGTPDEVIFDNTPLSELKFIFYSLASTGVTKATIQFQGIDGTPVDMIDGKPRTLNNWNQAAIPVPS